MGEHGVTPGPVADVLINMMRGGRAHVMMNNWRGKPRHLRVYRDGDGFYVRTGKRAVRKEYIRSYKKISADPFVAVFSTTEDAGQASWETAMGMRGYAGSAAEKEDRVTKARAESVTS